MGQLSFDSTALFVLARRPRIIRLQQLLNQIAYFPLKLTIGDHLTSNHHRIIPRPVSSFMIWRKETVTSSLLRT